MKKLLVIATMLVATLGLSSCANANANASSDPASMSSYIPILIIYGLLALAIYFFMIRPSSKKKKEEEQMRKSLEIGDEIITIGGITGRVVNIKDDGSFILETGPDRTKMLFQQWALSSITTQKELPDTKKSDKKDKVKVDEK